MTASSPIACEAPRPAPGVRLAAVGLLLAVLSALFFYKWGGAFRAVQGVDATGRLSVTPTILMEGGVMASTLDYFRRIWPALTYGIVIGAVVRAALPPSWIASVLGRRGATGTVAGALAGAPLMLCSCCVTPIFTGVYERGARLGSALAMMLAAPGLNVAALAITFTVMPARFGALRVVGAALVVLALAPSVGRWLGAGLTPGRGPSRAVTDVELPATWRSLALSFVKNLGYMTLVTVPLIVVGVLLSALLLPHAARLSSLGGAPAVVLVALLATLIALPTFFEIPIALLLVQLGAPPGVAIAVLVAGPIVNLPSLFVLARESSARVAVAVGVGVWVIASLAGLSVQLFP